MFIYRNLIYLIIAFINVFMFIYLYLSVIHVRESYFHVYFIRNKNNQSIIYMVIMLIGVASAESKKTEPEWKQKADEKRQRIISKQ